MGTKGKCYLGDCRIEGQTKWQFKGPHNNPYDAEQKALIDSVRNGQPINSGYHMANSTMVGVLGQLACYSGKPMRWDEVVQVRFPVRPAARHGEFPDPAAQQARRHRQLPAAAAGRDEVCDLSRITDGFKLARSCERGRRQRPALARVSGWCRRLRRRIEIVAWESGNHENPKGRKSEKQGDDSVATVS